MTDSIVEDENAWLDHATGHYETVISQTALYERFHLDNTTLRHHRVLSGEAHTEFECTDCHGANNLTSRTCTQCHPVKMNAHQTPLINHPAAFDNDNCLNSQPEAWPEHNIQIKQAGNDDFVESHRIFNESKIGEEVHPVDNASHAMVACVACHDASGLALDPMKREGIWFTFRTVELLGRSITKPYASHHIQLQLDSTRCHFPNNPWGLSNLMRNE
jgi:hypothetical protein